MDARYFATALIPVVPAATGLVKVMMSGDFSNGQQLLANFVDGVRIAAHGTALYSIYVGAMWFMSHAIRAGRNPVAQVRGEV